MSEVLLSVDAVTMQFGGVTALDNVSLHINKGEILGLIGPNGAGKTTCFNVITGVYTPTSGVVTFDNKSLFGLKRYQITKRGIARTFQNIQLFNDLTVIENLQIAQHNTVNKSLFAGVFNTKAFKESEQASIDRAYELLEVFNLTADANRLAGEMSYGQQRRLEIARAICTNPEMIALDEPAAGLNPNETEALAKMIQMLRTEFKMTVMLIEHDMGMVMKVSDFIIVLDHGEVIAKGTPDEILNNPKVIAAYLGVDDDEVAA